MGISHNFWIDNDGDNDIEYYNLIRPGLTGIGYPNPFRNNVFVHADPGDHEDKERIDDQEPIMHYIASRLVEWI